jgi:hypothetical protein
MARSTAIFDVLDALPLRDVLASEACLLVGLKITLLGENRSDQEECAKHGCREC